MVQTHLVVMGVAGCGKSEVGKEISHRLDWQMAEGDEFHPQANVDKMHAGQPLTDEDRWPWLDIITQWTAEQDNLGHNTIVTCSALRKVYRDRLRQAPGRTVFVHLHGTEELLSERLQGRQGHFMPPSLLPSQLSTLEALEADEDGVVVDITPNVKTIAETALEQLGLSNLASS
ncbi:MAG: gluconokinase [Ancrocorticia sp.]|uniref:gluconokinase n=1 Tax=Ancrocorticia sp. TaxID=2593684 RepID=UPI003F937368